MQKQRHACAVCHDFVIICRTRKDAEHAHKAVRLVMERLSLTLHPEKTQLVNLWDGKAGFDFLGFHHRWKKEKRTGGQEYHALWQWPRKKAMANIRAAVKAKLGRNTLKLCATEIVMQLNPSIRGWRQYYGLRSAKEHLRQLDWHILERLTIWHNQKKQRRHRHGHRCEVYQHFEHRGLELLSDRRMPQREGHRKAV